MEKQMMQVNKLTNGTKVLRYIRKNPNAKAKEVAKALKVSVNTVYQTTYLAKKKAKGVPKTAIAPKANWKLASVSTSKKSVFQKPSTLAPNAAMSMALHADMVNHPPHYKAGGIETIDFIEAKNLGYNLGNVVKYVSRADLKGNKVEDLQKARWYLDRAIANLTKT
jgi:DNA-binding CsgD family transcriptional regulator